MTRIMKMTMTDDETKNDDMGDDKLVTIAMIIIRMVSDLSLAAEQV